MPSGRLGTAGFVTAWPMGGKVHPADFRRQPRASPLCRAQATRPRLLRSVGKAIGAEGVGTARQATARSLPEAPRFGLLVAQPGRMGPGAGSRHLPSPVSSSYPGHPTRAGSPRARVRELERCGDTGMVRRKEAGACWSRAAPPGTPQTQELTPAREGAAAGTAPVRIGS